MSPLVGLRKRGGALARSAAVIQTSKKQSKYERDSDSQPKPPDGLLERMVESKQFSSADAAHSDASKRQRENPNPCSPRRNVLRWLAKEYDLGYTTLDDVEPDRELLSLFPARVLLKEELLPLQRVNGTVEVATSRLFATQGLDTLKTMTGLNLKPVLAPTEAIRREIKKRLGVGADTIDTLDEDGAAASRR